MGATPGRPGLVGRREHSRSCLGPAPGRRTGVVPGVAGCESGRRAHPEYGAGTASDHTALECDRAAHPVQPLSPPLRAARPLRPSVSLSGARRAAFGPGPPASFGGPLRSGSAGRGRPASPGCSIMPGGLARAGWRTPVRLASAVSRQGSGPTRMARADESTAFISATAPVRRRWRTFPAGGAVGHSRNPLGAGRRHGCGRCFSQRPPRCPARPQSRARECARSPRRSSPSGPVSGTVGLRRSERSNGERLASRSGLAQ